jgi:hypothetical protein
MTVSFEDEVSETIDDIIDFIDSINTEGSGRFWLINFLKHIESYAKPNVTYALCQNKIFAEEGLSCITNKGWVVAFKIEGDEMVVHHIVRGNILL